MLYSFNFSIYWLEFFKSVVIIFLIGQILVGYILMWVHYINENSMKLPLWCYHNWRVNSWKSELLVKLRPIIKTGAKD